MDKHTFFLIITVCFAVFFTGVMYVAGSVTTEQAQELKSKGHTEFTSMQQRMITAAQLAFYVAIITACFTVGEGVAQWLLN